VRTDGAHLRYRNGYFAEPEKIESESQATAAIQETAISPLDATSLGITVSGKLAGAAAGRKIELQIGIDPKQLLLQDAENHRKGAVDLYFVQRDAKGETVAAENQRIGLNLEEKQYEFLSKAGLILARHMIIAPEAAEVRVLMHDPASDALGSVTIQARPSGRIAE
jgi:ligand-binding sensor domain-containing protein